MKTALFATALLMSGAALAGPASTTSVQAPMGDYPACSRAVTDHCIQTNERGMGHAMRHARHRHHGHHR